MATNVDINTASIPGTIRDGVTGVLLVVNADGSINTSGGSGTSSTSINITQVAGVSVATGHGTAAGALRVELPTDGTGVVGLTAASTASNITQVAGATVATGHGTAAGALRVELPTDGTGVVGLTAASTASNITQVAGATIAQGHGTAATAIRVELPTDGTGVVGLNAGSAVIGHVVVDTGSAIVGKVGIDQTTPGTTNAVQAIPGTSGGMSKLSTLVANNTTAVVVKNSAGQVYAIECFNLSTTIAYLKIYDATSATAGSGTPTARYLIPGSAGPNGAGFVVTYPMGDTYTTGITQTVVTGFADNDATAPAASTYIVNVHYK